MNDVEKYDLSFSREAAYINRERLRALATLCTHTPLLLS
jgi:hypothetical protein